MFEIILMFQFLIQRHQMVSKGSEKVYQRYSKGTYYASYNISLRSLECVCEVSDQSNPQIIIPC